MLTQSHRVRCPRMPHWSYDEADLHLRGGVMSSAETIHREVADAWNRRDWNTYRNLLHPHYSYTGGDGKEMTGGPDTGLGVAQMYASAFPDAILEFRNV